MGILSGVRVATGIRLFIAASRTWTGRAINARFCSTANALPEQLLYGPDVRRGPWRGGAPPLIACSCPTA